MFCAFLKEQGLKYMIRRTRLLSALAAEYEWKFIEHCCSQRTCRDFVGVLFDKICVYWRVKEAYHEHNHRGGENEFDVRCVNMPPFYLCLKLTIAVSFIACILEITRLTRMNLSSLRRRRL